MVDKLKAYLLEHHWGIIQGVSGVYCAVFATWERFHPFATPQAKSPIVIQTGVAMMQAYRIPLWLWVGIVVLALSVAIPAIIGRFKSPIPLPGQNNVDDQKQREYYEIGIRTTQMFSELQLEAFHLVWSLNKWYSEFEPEPVYEGLQTGSGSTEAYLKWLLSGGPHGNWENKISASFSLHWEEKSRTLLLRFQEQGYRDYHLEGLINKVRGSSAKRFTEIRERLTTLALRSSGLDLKLLGGIDEA